MADKFEIKSFGVLPDEFVSPDPQLFFVTNKAMDRRSAQGAVRVYSALHEVYGRVTVTKDGTQATWTPIDHMPAGPYTFDVEELLSADGAVLEDASKVSFFVWNTQAQIPDDVIVQSVARLSKEPLGVRRLALDEALPESYFEIVKGVQRQDRMPVDLAFDAQGNQLEPTAALAEPETQRSQEGDKLHESLRNYLQDIGDEERVTVATWLYFDETPYRLEKPTNGSLSDAGEAAQARSEMRQQEAEWEQALAEVTQSFAEQMTNKASRSAAMSVGADAVASVVEAMSVEADTAAPVVYASLTKDEILELAQTDGVATVFLHEEEGIEDLSNSIAIANTDDVHADGFDGSGIKVAVWENGPDKTDNLVITASYSSAAGTSDHARHTHGIIKNKEENKSHGHAPGCLLYSANSKNRNALRWAVKDKSCTVISQSFHRSSEPHYGTLQADDIYKDWLAVHPPYPTILEAAGNYWSTDPDNVDPPEDEYVNHKGYNRLAVGNHNDNANAMSGDSVFRNPTSSHGDRELPEICANGTSVNTVGLWKSGTSMAAPAVAGCTALLQDIDSTLTYWPEGCRALLLAGATRNVAGNTWWQDVEAGNDSRDGAGALNIEESARICKFPRSRNASATRRGWDVGTSKPDDFGANKESAYSYHVRIPSNGPTHVKVVLAWDSKVTTKQSEPVSSALTVDMDLLVYDAQGIRVGYSGSYDNSYEIAEFDGKRGKTYTIKLRRWSGTDKPWFGIAWTVV